MTSKLKLFIIILVSSAGLIGFWLFSRAYESFKISSIQTNILKNGGNVTEDTPLTKDSDQDGLADRDEILYGTDPFVKDTDGDGLIDGEEVSTGYDPRDGSDEDRTRPTVNRNENGSPNLTDRFVNGAVAKMITDEGDINRKDIDPAIFADLIKSNADQAALATYIPPLTDADLAIINQTDKKTVQEYLNRLTPILEESQIALTSIARQINSIKATHFDGYIFFQQKYLEMKSIPVPSNWKEIHKSVMTIFLQMADGSQYFNVQKINEDPLRAMLMIQRFRENIFSAQELTLKITTLARQQKIDLDNSLLQLLLNKSQAP